jgi:hypothetical protein
MDHCCLDRMVVRVTPTYKISAQIVSLILSMRMSTRSNFFSKICQRLAADTDKVFSRSTQFSTTNKTDVHDKYMLSLIGFASMDFSSQYRINGEA